MTDGVPTAGGVRDTLHNIRWSLDMCRKTSPHLYRAAWANALIGTMFPAGSALAARGLINAVNDGLKNASALEPRVIYFWLLVGVVMTVGTVLHGSTLRYINRRLEIDLHFQLHLELLRHNNAMPFVNQEDPDFHDARRRAQNTPESHVARCLSSTVDLITRAVQIAGLLAILVAIEPILFALLIPVGVPYLAFQWRMSRRQFQEIDERIAKDRWLSYYRDILSGERYAAEIRVFGLGPLFLERGRQFMAEFRTLRSKYVRAEFLGNLAFALLSVVAIYLAMTRAVFSIMNGRLTIGDLAIYGTAATQVRALVEGSIGLVAGLRWEILHIGGLRAFLAIPTHEPRANAVLRPALKGGIEFRNLTFAYPGAAAPTLANVSFTIAPGEAVALVGANGAGKTTIAKLIACLHEPTDGELLFDGLDVRTLDVEHVRRQMTCLFQNFGRYAATAADNIAFGDVERLMGHRDRIEEVARAAGVHDMITAMPRGYDTILSRGFGRYDPSGGQWQQIAIARAFARDARILILDEPTASLDVDTEYRLFLRYRALAEGRTLLLISHRFSTVRMADRILVLDAAQVVENGTHDELMKLGGRYAVLYDLHRQHLGVT